MTSQGQRFPRTSGDGPLTHIRDVSQQYRKFPADTSDIFYHYTTQVGLEGILRCGGLRATYRMKMNDPDEFKYARDLVFDALNEAESRQDGPGAKQSLTTCVRENLERLLLNDTPNASQAYCACLTFSPDDPMQWKTYAENGNGFAIGLNLLEILRSQTRGQMMGEPFVYCARVSYNAEKQRALVADLVTSGLLDLRAIVATCSEPALCAFRHVAEEIVVQLLTLIDLFKAQTHSREREMRLFVDPNSGTLDASNVQHYERDNELIPFVFMNLCSPHTGQLPLAEIKIGPNAAFAESRRFIECLLNELGYRSNLPDYPRITRSSVFR